MATPRSEADSEYSPLASPKGKGGLLLSEARTTTPQPSKVPGTMVEYLSTRHGGWVPATVQGFDSATGCWVLDIQPVALPSKVRAPSVQSSEWSSQSDPFSARRPPSSDFGDAAHDTFRSQAPWGMPVEEPRSEGHKLGPALISVLSGAPWPSRQAGRAQAVTYGVESQGRGRCPGTRPKYTDEPSPRPSLTCIDVDALVGDDESLSPSIEVPDATPSSMAGATPSSESSRRGMKGFGLRRALRPMGEAAASSDASA